ncbi:MAG TPA: YIP1 family protein [Rhodocyclaceae bacterium]|nr:YIP1 family protein [Rhodocyclaceae bacterium]
MSLMSLPKMFVSETEGWSDLVRIHPSVRRLFMFFVAPMSLLPPVMHAYAQLEAPGAVFPSLAPVLALQEAVIVGGVFFLIELATVTLMAYYIQQMADSFGVPTDYPSAYTLAAVAPTPLWVASLALFIPSLWFNVAVLVVAWVASAALIRHGVRPILRAPDSPHAHKLANAITLVGVLAWIGLIMVMVLMLGMLIGLR